MKRKSTKTHTHTHSVAILPQITASLARDLLGAVPPLLCKTAPMNEQAAKEAANQALEIVLQAAQKAEEVDRKAREAILHELTKLVSIATGQTGQEDTT